MILQIKGLCSANNLFIWEFLRYFGKIERISINRDEDLVLVLFDSLSSSILALDLDNRKDVVAGKLSVTFCLERFTTCPAAKLEANNENYAQIPKEGKTFVLYFSRGTAAELDLDQLIAFLEIQFQSVAHLKPFKLMQTECEIWCIFVEFTANVRPPLERIVKFQDWDFCFLDPAAVLAVEGMESGKEFAAHRLHSSSSKQRSAKE